MSAGLERPGAQVAFDSDRRGDVVVASALSEDAPGDYNAGLVYSVDGGSTWAWGGVVAEPQRTFPEGVAVVDGGAVIVGSSQSGEADLLTSRAFMAKASAPDYVPQQVALPAEFDGDGVHLQDVAIVDGEWIIIGYSANMDAESGVRKPVGMMWRSKDAGSTWTSQEIKTKNIRELTLMQIVIAPDGSWNIVGQGGTGDVIEQYDPVWLKSKDRGETFKRMTVQAFVGDFDQGADSIAFAQDGSAAINGWDEMNDEHGTTASALWMNVPGHGTDRIGGPQIPIEGGKTPAGDFVDGVVWDATTPVVWGSKTGAYPAPAVQFWTVKGAKLSPTTELVQEDKPVAIDSIIPDGAASLAFGLVGPIDSADIAIWRGSLGPS